MLVLHVGLPKTATTYLQSNVFGRIPELHYVHRGQGSAAEALCATLRRYVRANGLRSVWLRRKLREGLAPLAAQADAAGRPLLISDENISLHSVQFWRGRAPSPDRVALRLAELGRYGGCGPVRVVIGLRAQETWLASFYAQSGRQMPDADQADFDRRAAEIAGAKALVGPQLWLDHHHVLRALVERLGAENVHPFLLERLEARPGWTLAQMGAFIGGEELGERFRRRAKKTQDRRSNVSATGDGTWRIRTEDERVLVLSDALRQAIADRFAASNRAFEAARKALRETQC